VNALKVLEDEHTPKSEAMEFARLLDWVEDRLSEQDARTLEEHVSAADSSTRADVAWLRVFFRISEDTVISSPHPACETS
jgi:hypothetical protein